MASTEITEGAEGKKERNSEWDFIAVSYTHLDVYKRQLLNVALYAVLRFKMLMSANPDALTPGPLLVGVGLASLLFAALMIYRRGDIKRLFASVSYTHLDVYKRQG